MMGARISIQIIFSESITLTNTFSIPLTAGQNPHNFMHLLMNVENLELLHMPTGVLIYNSCSLCSKLNDPLNVPKLQ